MNPDDKAFGPTVEDVKYSVGVDYAKDRMKQGGAAVRRRIARQSQTHNTRARSFDANGVEIPFTHAVLPLDRQPQMLPRPEGMSRQTHRRLYREACKLAGVDYRTAGKATP